MKAENTVIATADGTPVDLAHAQCMRCSGIGCLELEMRFEAAPPGTYSLAGVQPKVSAREVPWLVCRSCGASSRGKS